MRFVGPEVGAGGEPTNSSMRYTPRSPHGDLMHSLMRDAKLPSPRSICRHADFVTMTSSRLLLFATLALTACGGGGNDSTVIIDGRPSALTVCSLPTNSTLTLAYEVNGLPYDATRPINLTIGQTVTAAPRLLGLPSTCSNSVNWRFSLLTSSGSGLTANAATGAISGTPRSGDILEVSVNWFVVGTPQVGAGTFRFVGHAGS